MLKSTSLTIGLYAAGLFLATPPASAAQIGIGAAPEMATTIEAVQYGYGRPGYGYGRRAYGGRGYGYGRRFYGGPRYGRGYGPGRGYGYGRRSFY